MYQRVGAAAYKADLETTNQLDRLTGFPHRQFKSIHIAGTNGKGSVSHFLAAVLQSAGYKTGLYTSPHLTDFRERIKINGVIIPEEEIVKFVEKYKSDFDIIRPSFFEMTAAMAFKHFSNEKIDIAVIETGMGGRLDSTNIISPEVSVITNIGFDHTMFLGDTYEKIAKEKAGIIKKDTPVIIGEYNEKTKKVFQDISSDVNAPIYFASDLLKANIMDTGHPDFTLYNIIKNNKLYISELKCGLKGFYQINNIITSLQTLESLKLKGIKNNIKHILEGFEKVVTLTGIRGRWEIIDNNPQIICDIAHNAEGLSMVIDQLANTDHNKLHFILGMVKEKNPDLILKLFPKDARYYFTRAEIPRSMDQIRLKKISRTLGLNGDSYPDVRSAFTSAKKNATKNDIIFIGGSTYIVADFLSFAHIHQKY